MSAPSNPSRDPAGDHRRDHRRDHIRDYIVLYVNGQRHEIRGALAWSTLADFLRRSLRLTGTKIVCAEGDCGACSVLLGRAIRPLSQPGPSRDPSYHFAAVDACILFLFQLDLCHVITVEGLGAPERLHPVQSAMIDHFGSQCGFCTPGFVTTLAGLVEHARSDSSQHAASGSRLDETTIERALTGNLCRCTGYLQIREAAAAVEVSSAPALADLHELDPWLEELGLRGDDTILIRDSRPSEAPGLDTPSQAPTSRQVLVPSSLDAALDHLARYPGARVLAGATDLGVQVNKGRTSLEQVLVLSERLTELHELSIEDNVLVAGAAVPWSRLLGAIEDRLPELAKILELFGAPQIRHLATVGGNIVNASPIADSVPFLLVCGASLEVRGRRGERRIAIGDFYRGYKQVDLERDELLTRVVVPLPTKDESLRLYKVSKRRDLDISSFTAAFLLRRSAGIVTRARVALGGVGPVVRRLPEAEKALEGRVLDLETARAAGRIASQLIEPISDIRGSVSYRRQLAENIFVRLYYDEDEPAADRRPTSSARS